MKGGEKHDACQNNHSRGTKSVSAKLLHLEAYARSRGHIKQIHDRNFNLLSSVTVEPFTSFLEPTLNLFTANRRRSQVNSNMTSRADAQRVPAGFLPGQWATPDTSEGGGGDGEGWACVRASVSFCKRNRFNARKVHISVHIVGLSVCDTPAPARYLPFPCYFLYRAWAAH